MVNLNREQERALRAISRLEKVPANRFLVEDHISPDCLSGLVESGYVRYAQSDSERDVYDRIERLTAGRCYFDEVRRDRWRRWAPVVVGSLLGAVIGGAFTIAGVLLGASLR